ncbi:MAG: FkbM family methyltransferase [Acidobacteria bacterium]|nr:MAG: FkbM family methyltransferase [Acidobacteriota bacterium]
MKKSLVYRWRKLMRPRYITQAGVRLDLGTLAFPQRKVMYRGVYEKTEGDVVTRNLARDDVVLEIGAGIGLVTILCCRKIGSDRVYAYEANPLLEMVLRTNFSLNGVSPHLSIKLVSLTGGEGDFYVADRFMISSRYAPAVEKRGVTVQRQRVASEALPDILKRVRPTFLIVDAEGAEMDLADDRVVLQGVRKICMEVHPHIVGDQQISRLIDSLTARGFALILGESQGKVLYFSRLAVGGLDLVV